MYAIVIYDLIKQMVYLIRDPAGIKPLYFASTKYGWIFASQYNQIFKHLWFKSDIQVNIDSLADYLRLGYIPAPSALFKILGCCSLEHFLTINCELFAHLRQYHVLGINVNISKPIMLRLKNYVTF